MKKIILGKDYFGQLTEETETNSITINIFWVYHVTGSKPEYRMLAKSKFKFTAQLKKQKQKHISVCISPLSMFSRLSTKGIIK